MEIEKLKSRAPLDLDNPNDVDWLYDWAQQAQKRITELEVKNLQQPAEPLAVIAF